MVEFLRGILEQLREYPEIAELLMGLAAVAPAYTVLTRSTNTAKPWRSVFQTASVNSSQAYKEQLGERGLEACISRQLGHAACACQLSAFLTGDVTGFRAWWRKRIGQNIVARRETLRPIPRERKQNFNELINALWSQLDRDEAETIEMYLRQIFAVGQSNVATEKSGQNKRMVPIGTFAASIQPRFVADVAAMK